MWRVLALAAVLWPSRVSGILDGPPLDTPIEALTLGLLFPVLISYTGVFSVFHGTQREFLAVWKPGMPPTAVAQAMVSSVMTILTATDPPAFTWTGLPLLIAAVVAIAALAGVPVLRQAPAPVAALFLAGCVGALVTRGWGYEGRFSLHLFAAASALCAWAAAAICSRLLPSKVNS